MGQLSSDVLYACLQCDLSEHFPDLGILNRTSNHRDSAYAGITGRRFAALSLADSLLKKFKDAKAEDADSKALAKFLDANERCNRKVGIDTSNITEIEVIAIGEAKKFIYDFCFNYEDLDPQDPSRWVRNPIPEPILSLDKILEGIGPGPGASVAARGQSFYQKMADSPLSTTSDALYRLYKGWSLLSPVRDETEKIRSKRYPVKVVEGNSLSFVPKSTSISRTICTEPLLNMLFQKGVGAILESELKRKIGIDLSVQPDKNRELARIGSLTGRYGTIDLSSASDTISLSLVDELFPPSVTGWLKAVRSPATRLPDGKYTQLHMVSSMGNAFTFPLQTIIFSSVVIGVYRSLDMEIVYPRGKSLGNFAVFGDDIIVRRKAYDLVCRLLHRFGFEVNLTKSYNDGAFRESCGSDFWNGYGVRGIYLESLKTKQDVYSAINRLMVWMADHDIFLPRVMRYLTEVGKPGFLPVPPHEADIAGIKVPLWLVSDDLPRDRNRSIVYRRYQPVTAKVDLRTVDCRPQKGGNRSLKLWLESEQKRKRLGIRHNAPGILLSAVGGYLRDGQIHIKSRGPVYYQKRMATTPCWDWYDPCQMEFNSPDGWHRWKSIYVSLVFWKD